ncbi:hypothetical protein M5K25_014889 [Dendrobium thyrsiflorum]|uniref:DUF4283 domain-containing protein n=1 Tax=Dendrobium thyrsiflorum TaxID=117978 RepID=A0ABD0UPF4_DENTH
MESFLLLLLNAKNVLIKFLNDLDYCRVFSHWSYFISNCFMKLFKWTPHFDINIESSTIPIWVSFPSLRPHLFLPRILHGLGSLFGWSLRTDNATSNGLSPSVAHVLVEIDVTKRYPDHVWVGSESMGYIQMVEFEEIPLIAVIVRYECHILYPHLANPLFPSDGAGEVLGKNSAENFEPVSTGIESEIPVACILESEHGGEIVCSTDVGNGGNVLVDSSRGEVVTGLPVVDVSITGNDPSHLGPDGTEHLVDVPIALLSSNALNAQLSIRSGQNIMEQTDWLEGSSSSPCEVGEKVVIDQDDFFSLNVSRVVRDDFYRVDFMDVVFGVGDADLDTGSLARRKLPSESTSKFCFNLNIHNHDIDDCRHLKTLIALLKEEHIKGFVVDRRQEKVGVLTNASPSKIWIAEMIEAIIGGARLEAHMIKSSRETIFKSQRELIDDSIHVFVGGPIVAERDVEERGVKDVDPSLLVVEESVVTSRISHAKFVEARREDGEEEAAWGGLPWVSGGWGMVAVAVGKEEGVGSGGGKARERGESISRRTGGRIRRGKWIAHNVPRSSRETIFKSQRELIDDSIHVFVGGPIVAERDVEERGVKDVDPSLLVVEESVVTSRISHAKFVEARREDGEEEAAWGGLPWVSGGWGMVAVAVGKEEGLLAYFDDASNSKYLSSWSKIALHEVMELILFTV